MEILWNDFVCVGEILGSQNSPFLLYYLARYSYTSLRLQLLIWQKETSAQDSTLIPQNKLIVGWGVTPLQSQN